MVKDCLVNCSLTVRSELDSVTYNGLELDVIGDKTNHETEKLINFESCEKRNPRMLTIKGRYKGGVTNDYCYWGTSRLVYEL